MELFALYFLGLVGAGLVISSIVLTRDYGSHGILALLSGVGVIVGCYFWLLPLARAPSLTADAASLRAELSAANAKVENAIQSIKDANARKEAAERERAEAASLLDRTLQTLNRDVSDAQRPYVEPHSAIYSDAPAVMDDRPNDTADIRIERIRAGIESLSRLKTRQAAHIETSQVAPQKPEPESGVPSEDGKAEGFRDLLRLKDLMSARFETDHYNVEVYPQRELVGGHQGKYYVIDFKNASNGIRYYFEGGKYSLPSANSEFRTSLNTFISDVLKKMEGKVRYDLYVRGSADVKPYQGTFEPGHEYRNVSFLKNAGNDRYESEPSRRTLANSVRNDDLPNLRAKFMSDVVAENYPVKRPVILEGSVSPNVSDRDRNVELILFVDW